MSHDRLGKSSEVRPRGITILVILLILLGLFALVCSLYLWGEGFLFGASVRADHILPITDLLVTVPAAFIAAVGLWRMSWWGFVASYAVVGILLYSSVAVYVMLAQQGPPYPLPILLPPLAGLGLASALIMVLWRTQISPKSDGFREIKSEESALMS